MLSTRSQWHRTSFWPCSTRNGPRILPPLAQTAQIVFSSVCYLISVSCYFGLSR